MTVVERQLCKISNYRKEKIFWIAVWLQKSWMLNFYDVNLVDWYTIYFGKKLILTAVFWKQT